MSNLVDIDKYRLDNEKVNIPGDLLLERCRDAGIKNVLISEAIFDAKSNSILFWLKDTHEYADYPEDPSFTVKIDDLITEYKEEDNMEWRELV